MPFALLIIGLFLLVAGVRDTQDCLFALVKGDFQGNDNFIFWFLAILIIGAIGYIPNLKPFSTAFLILLLVVLFLKKGTSAGVGGGFFTQFTSAISGATTPSGLLSGVTPPSTLAQLSSANQQQLDSIRQALQANMAAEHQLQLGGSPSGN